MLEKTSLAVFLPPLSQGGAGLEFCLKQGKIQGVLPYTPTALVSVCKRLTAHSESSDSGQRPACKRVFLLSTPLYQTSQPSKAH